MTASRQRTRAGALVTLMVLLTALLPTAAQGQGRSERVADTDDPVDVSILLSQFAHQSAPAVSIRIVIGRSDLEPDNLAAASIASEGGVLLLHPPAPAAPDQRVLDEIAFLRQNSGCAGADPNGVFIMGGTAALSADLEDAIGPCAGRVAGPNRNATSVEAARVTLDFVRASGDVPDRLFVARNDNAADSASASAVVAALRAPLVVTPRDSLAAEVEAFLRSETFQEIIILGGPAAISDPVVEQIVAAAPATPVVRVSGSSRDGTAVEVAQLFPLRSSWAMVEGFRPDFWTYALPAGPVMASRGAALLYTNGTTGGLGASAQALSDFPPTELLIVGPEARISTQTQADAEATAFGP